MKTTLLINNVAVLVSGCHLPKNCQELLKMNPGALDGNYTVDFNGQEAVIYCYNMTTGAPREYINLMQENSFYILDVVWIGQALRVKSNKTTFYSKVAVNSSVSLIS